MPGARAIDVDVVSDVVCPWCYIGQKRLDKAITLAGGIEVGVRWRPFQLDPSIPAAGLDRRKYMLAKFGSEEKLRDMHARIEALGAAEGIDFDFKAIRVSPNTVDAHRVIRWAGAAGSDVQGRLVSGLFRLYFERGADVGDHSVLVDAAAEAGMDAPIVAAMLPTDADREAVATEAATAARMGISGVPCFLLEGRYALMGAQEATTLAEAITEIAEAKACGRPGGAAAG